jgi:hypothetical protein
LRSSIENLYRPTAGGQQVVYPLILAVSLNNKKQIAYGLADLGFAAGLIKMDA